MRQLWVLVGIDTFDLLLDLVVVADRSRFEWKDEDKYAQASRLGLIDDRLHAEVEGAREQVVELVRSCQAPFAQDWTWWRPDPAWTVPALPDGVGTAGGSRSIVAL